ncbi:MAG: KamA family protein [Bacteroidetes bacterium]|nr:KamA family protein [Bacteroidota bacterium]MBT4970386.1 KamA family protein [Bacteroidota bacterium]MBT5529057.1 KamA family protein [Cytophagia bacterium]MBT5991507.1 KamA family protein [Bacteroidota bacterium]MBT7827075.1 KamA family protein [Bacteroidota bacterium]
MYEIEKLDKIAITVHSHKLLRVLLNENPILEEIMRESKNETEALIGVKNWVMSELVKSPDALAFYKGKTKGRIAYEKLNWEDFAAIRILDYVDNAGRSYEDLNLKGEKAVSNPVKLIWLAVTKGTGGAKPYFFDDMIQLFRQLSGTSKRVVPSSEKIFEWINRWPTGTDPRIIKLREENRDRIINIFIDKIDNGEISDRKYFFDEGSSREQKYLKMLEWWDEKSFHLRFAVREPDMLNELLGSSLDPDSMKILYDAKKQGIPFFVNPYYLSLLHVRVPYFAIGADLAIRHYIIYSEQLVKEFGEIVAWEKEDKVESGKPNAAGWLLPSHNNIHRRYPEVAILIPDTVGRACGGLCSSCQRMYDFQRGNLNFNLDKLKPKETWPEKLKHLMAYFENDSQLRDILITGGDALMSSDKSLKSLLDEIYNMAIRKTKANKKRNDGEKYAEIQRVRLGSRLPVYLPQRITSELTSILKEFKTKATKIGIKQFVIQTHFESPMEVTPESVNGISKLIESGWTITNQLVFSTAASRRGHSSKLRKVLNDIGVLTYYTFSVKGYMENNHNFATNERAVQEQLEEKIVGKIDEKYFDLIKEFPHQAENMVTNINKIRLEANLPFLATDRNVLNLPGVGKSLTYRVIGITRYGRRILEFDHDRTRSHSPIINTMGKVVIIESKSISEYLEQLVFLGEQIEDYENIYGYSIGETEPRVPLFEYPAYNYKLTEEFTNLEI